VIASLSCPLEHAKQRRNHVIQYGIYRNDVANHRTYIARSSETFLRAGVWLAATYWCMFDSSKSYSASGQTRGHSSSVHGRWEIAATGGQKHAILIRGRRFPRLAKVLKKF
jgi:hypothetical protein